MRLGFFIPYGLNYRGVCLSSFNYAFYLKKYFNHKIFIFCEKKNRNNKIDILKKFKKNFKVFSINRFDDIQIINKKIKLDAIYIQKSGNPEFLVPGVKNFIHAIFPQKLGMVHGDSYYYISNWLSQKYSNNKIPVLNFIIDKPKILKNLRKKFLINEKALVIGYHGGETSFDIEFVKDSVIQICKNNTNNIYFLFLNVPKFFEHPNIFFLKGTSDRVLISKFINTCDVMLHARSLGESFGLSCCEFAMQNKIILTYGFCMHRNHIHEFKNNIIVYYTKKDLINKILNLKKKKKNK